MKLLGTERVGNRIERHWLHYGEDGRKKLTVETIEDVQPILEANKRAYNEAPTRHGDGFERVASIPMTVIEEVCRTKGIPYAEFVGNKTDRAQSAWKELLNAPEFRYFRTRPGRV